jgi:polysaccharide chain length determinant protein (PEP-CTERM system associated)
MSYTPDDTPERTVTSDTVIDIWRRRKAVAALAFIAVLAAAVTVTMALPDLYRATSTVIIERQQVSEEFVRPTVTAELETRLQTIHQQVTSRAELQKVIERLNLYPEMRGVVPAEALADRMRNEDIDLQLTGVDETTGGRATIAFTVTYSGRDPRKVAEVANTLAQLYADRNTTRREQQATQTAAFLKTQLEDVARELQRQEARTGQFRQRYSGELETQVEVNLAALDRFNTQLRLNADQQLRAHERRDRLERERIEAELAALPTQSPDSPAARLVRARQTLAELRRKFSDQYPDVVRAQAEVEMLEKQVTAAPDPTAKLTRQAIQEVDAQLAELAREEKVLRQAIANYEARIEAAPRNQQAFQQISRDYQITNDRYQGLLKRYEEAQLAENLEQGRSVEQFRILDAAIPPAFPAAPNRTWLLFLGVVAALGAAIAAVVVAERLDRTVHGVDELRELTDVPTLAAIPLITTVQSNRRRWFRRAVATAAVILGVSGIVAASYYVAAGNERIVRLTSRAGV